jgi:hypothetical protein
LTAERTESARILRHQQHGHGLVGAADESGDRCEGDELNREIDADDFLSWADGDLSGFRRADHTGIVGRRVPGRLGFVGGAEAAERSGAAGASTGRTATSASGGDAGRELLESAANQLCEAARGRADVVVARRQAEHAVLAAVVGLIAAGRCELTFAADVLVALRGHHGARERLAVFIEHVARDHAAARQTQIDVRGVLRVHERDRRAGLLRAALSEDRIHEAGLRCRDGVGARRELGHTVPSLLVGDGRAAAASASRDRDPGAFDRSAGVAGEHAT